MRQGGRGEAGSKTKMQVMLKREHHCSSGHVDHIVVFHKNKHSNEVSTNNEQSMTLVKTRDHYHSRN